MGDSITDAGRSREIDSHMGEGYPTLVSAALGFEHPNDFRFLNRGISGDRIIDLLARIKADMINLQPDYMSILIGVNDVWHGLNVENPNGVDAEMFEVYYDLLLKQLFEALPDVKIVILGAFLTPGSATNENWNVFRSEVEKRAVISQKLAAKYGLPFVPLQERFDAACKLAPAEHWTHDGVHPTDAGHELIKRAWLEAFPG